MVARLLREDLPAVPDIYDLLGDSLITVPSHWPLEIGNALRSNIRAGRITADVFETILADLKKFQIRVERSIPLDEIGPVTQFALDQNLTAYDASYVRTAMRWGATLATIDGDMRASANRLSIPLLPA